MSRIVASPLFADRAAAGQALAVELGAEPGSDVVVVGLARGGVEVAAEIARALGAPLDVVAVRKIGHPFEREYGIGAVTPGDGVYVRASDGLSADRLAVAVEETKAQAALLDRNLHAEHPPLDLRGRTVLLIDDGLATGATMVAAVRWAKAAEAGRVVVGVPVAASASITLLRREADDVVVLYPLTSFFSVSSWYEAFPPVDEAEVVRVIHANRSHYGR
jgi:putative phosphoribosyl transferase